MADILTLGELLIDLTQHGSDGEGHGQFIAYPGGAPANVAVAAARLGAATEFIGKVGRDAFGRTLRETLDKEGVSTDGLYESTGAPTTLAIVSVDEAGEREFAFYRKPGADTQLTEYEAVSAIDRALSGSGCKAAERDDQADHLPILHVGSLSMTDSPAREACELAVRYAEDHGLAVSYDPNYRASLWDSEAHAVEMMKKLLPFADILKVSDEEMVMLTGTDDPEEGSRILAGYGRKGIRLVMVTLGADGVFVRLSGLPHPKHSFNPYVYDEPVNVGAADCIFAEQVPGFSVKVADTNGAGDTFMGAMLSQIVRRAAALSDDADILTDLTGDELRRMVTYANRAASLTCSRPGAMPAMPTAAEVEALI